MSRQLHGAKSLVIGFPGYDLCFQGLGLSNRKPGAQGSFTIGPPKQTEGHGKKLPRQARRIQMYVSCTIEVRFGLGFRV